MKSEIQRTAAAPPTSRFQLDADDPRLSKWKRHVQNVADLDWQIQRKRERVADLERQIDLLYEQEKEEKQQKKEI